MTLVIFTCRSYHCWKSIPDAAVLRLRLSSALLNVSISASVCSVARFCGWCIILLELDGCENWPCGYCGCYGKFRLAIGIFFMKDLLDIAGVVVLQHKHVEKAGFVCLEKGLNGHCVVLEHCS